MNPFGSYRALLGNSTSAILAAIEIYNKPRFEYRSECFVILLLNAWELLFKGILSKNRRRIFEPKKKGEPYHTLLLGEAMKGAQEFFPANIPYKAVSENIMRLVDYRNNAVHFYNEEGFETVIYGLAQTSIVNFRDLTESIFGKDIAREVNIYLLPLSFSAPPDPIAFLGDSKSKNPAVTQFLKIISDTTKDLEGKHIDTGRFLTVFKVSLQSTKKVQAADVVVGVESTSENGLLLVEKKIDPNKSHPNRRMDIVNAIGKNLRGIPFTTYVFEAVVWRLKAKENSQLCWCNANTNANQYSPELIQSIKNLTADQITESLSLYKAHVGQQKNKAKSKKFKT